MMLTAARRLALDLDWPVLPLCNPNARGCSCGKSCCQSVGKHPIAALVPRGLLHATTDPDVLEEWWGRYPLANIGVRCTRILVLDIDPRAGGSDSLKRIERAHGKLPETALTETGSAGRHFIFRGVSGPVRGKLDMGIDIKTSTGYVVAPPSLHASGRRYSWLREPGCGIAAAPDWLLQMLSRDPPAVSPSVCSADGNRLRRARAYARALPPAMSGQHGHDATFLAAYSGPTWALIPATLGHRFRAHLGTRSGHLGTDSGALGR